jgi:tetratricopeptide (TPR) repeat protein
VWQEYVKAHPDDLDGTLNLARCLRQLRRYREASDAYEAAVAAHPDRTDLQAELAAAYLEAGQRGKAEAAFRKLAQMDPSSDTLNDLAYRMANEDFQLPLALDYAKKAVKGAEEESQKITLTDLKMENVRDIFKVSAYWDTLGWVHERMSNLEEAESYLQASWKLTQDGIVASHLCHLYRRVHKTAAAIEMCQAALYRIPLSGGSLAEAQTEMASARENLKFMQGGSEKSNKGTMEASDKVTRERTFKMARFLPGTESAEFFVLLASDGKSKTFKVEDVKFVSGSDKMKLQGKQLKSIPFNFVAPGSVPARFVRRGILGCYQYSGCSFVLLDPSSVKSLD